MKVFVEKLDHFGRGISFIQGKTCFIENALENEVVEIEITKEHKNYTEARVLSYESTSLDRIEEVCPYAKMCGGCSCQHFTFEKENKWKEEKVKEAIQKFANIKENIVLPIRYQNEFYYRNKITLHGKEGKLGFYQKNSHDLIPIQKCLLANHKINQILPLLQNHDFKEVMIKTSNDEKEIAISIQGKKKEIESLKKIADVLKINGSYETEKTRILTKIGKKEYEESISSFFQMNQELIKDLYEEVKKVVKEKRPNTVLDLYCGTGSIGLYGKEYCENLIGIDSNEENIKDAKINQKKNSNITFICDKVENRTDIFENADLIIVDPPRKGLDKKTKEFLNVWKGNTIVYVSCDPITLARDLKDFKEKYNVLSIQPFNMFPRTYHVETISVLERK